MIRGVRVGRGFHRPSRALLEDQGVQEDLACLVYLVDQVVRPQSCREDQELRLQFAQEVLEDQEDLERDGLRRSRVGLEVLGVLVDL